MAQPKARGLGKGLGALFGDLPPVGSEAEAAAAAKIPISQIEPNPHQPRRDFSPEELDALADSIRTHGVISPLTVRKQGEIYQIIAGERRWRAARIAGLSELPVYCIEADDRTVMELALIENLQRQDLNPIEEAQGFRSLIDDYGLTQEEISERIGKSRSAVANALRLLHLCQPVQALVKEGKLSPGHARALIPLSDQRQAALAEIIVQRQLSVRQTEALVKQEGRAPKPAKDAKALFQVDYLAECERSLERKLGRGVKIVQGKKKGHFELEFYDLDDLERLMAALEDLDLKNTNHTLI